MRRRAGSQHRQVFGRGGGTLPTVKKALITTLRDRWMVKIGNGPDLSVQGNNKRSCSFEHRLISSSRYLLLEWIPPCAPSSYCDWWRTPHGRRYEGHVANSAGQIYSVCVRSILDEGWVRALDVEPIETHRHYSGPPRTILTLRLADQSEMLGLLNRLHNMSLTVLSVELNCRRRIPADSHRWTGGMRSRSGTSGALGLAQHK